MFESEKEKYLKKRKEACIAGAFNSRRQIYLFYTNEVGLSPEEAQKETDIECFNLQISEPKPTKTIEEWVDYGINMYNKHPKIVEGLLGGVVGGFTALAGSKASKTPKQLQETNSEKLEIINIDESDSTN